MVITSTTPTNSFLLSLIIPKLLTVFGVTGQQGEALARHVLKTPSLRAICTLRGVTRDASKAAAIALRQEGVEIV